MTPFQYLTVIAFVLTCIIVTYLNSLKIVRVMRRRDECMIALYALMRSVRDIKAEDVSNDMLEAYKLGTEALKPEKLKKDLAKFRSAP